MSGENCFDILYKIFKPKKEESIDSIKGYTMKYGFIVDNKGIKKISTGEPLTRAIEPKQLEVKYIY